MQKINNYEFYVSEMRKSMGDKLFFIDMLDSSIDTVVDFGCANGDLVKTAKMIKPCINFVGYDINEDMLSMARSNAPDIEFCSDWNVAKQKGKKRALNICSTIHEIYTYLDKDGINDFWAKVFGGDFDTVIIRDMIPDERYDVPCTTEMREKVRSALPYEWMWQDFEMARGDIETELDILELLMKYRYVDNWDREARENYFPLSLPELVNLIPDGYEIKHCERYALPFFVDLMKEQFDIDINKPTHAKIIISKRINN